MLHHNEVSSLALANVVDSNNVGLIQRRSGFSLLHEEALPLGVLRPFGGQTFDDNLPLKPRILGQPDFAHSIFSQRRDDFVRAKPPTCQRRRSQPRSFNLTRRHFQRLFIQKAARFIFISISQ